MAAKPKKICFVGGPSTGKTTLAKYLQDKLRANNHSAEWVGEFARDFIINKGQINEPIAQLAIVRGQKEREIMAYNKNPEFILCDAASFLPPVYFHFLCDGKSDKNDIGKLNEIEKEIWREMGGEISSYDFVFFLPVEFTPEKDGVRLFTDQASDISNRIQQFMDSNNIKYYELRGTVEQRANRALEIICPK